MNRIILACIGWVLVSTSAGAIDRYVAKDNPGAASPYTDWATAAANIQDAIDAAVAGETVWVSNGVYNTGGSPAAGLLQTNRVVIDKAITVHGVNGPGETFISGAFDSSFFQTGGAAIRGVWMTNGSALIGFTVSSGSTHTVSGENSGGGVWCQSMDVVISNCIIRLNRASSSGGGFYGGTVVNSSLSANRASRGSGAAEATIYDCIISSNTGSSHGAGAYLSTIYSSVIVSNIGGQFGGGVARSTVENSTISANTASNGAGAYQSSIHDSLLTLNVAGDNGGGAIECMISNCLIIGNSGKLGGGIYNSHAANSIISKNIARLEGGGAFSGSINNSLLVENHALFGGGARSSSLSNCTVVGNSATNGGGGVRIVQAWNCIVYSNRSLNGEANYTNSTFTNSCTFPLPPGDGNITNSPLFVDPAATNFQLTAESPCRDAGSNAFVVAMVDLAGNPRIANGIVDMGAYEFQLDAPAGAVDRYVAKDNPGAMHPYTNWVTAAANIQDAIDAAIAGDTVWVSNGIFNTGGRALSGQMLTNRVLVDKPLILKSLNGPQYTSIVGSFDPISTNGDAAVRCVYLTNGAYLSGFTISNGATRMAGTAEIYGGGIYCPSTSANISNCIIVANNAFSGAAGLYAGRVTHSVIINNLCHGGSGAGIRDGIALHTTITGNRIPGPSLGGGAHNSTLINCMISSNAGNEAGGAYVSTLSNCVVRNNSGGLAAGGISGGHAYNTLFTANKANRGGGAYAANLYNCTMIGNTGTQYGGGTYYVNTAVNCIVYYNSPDNYTTNFLTPTFVNSCTYPIPALGMGNVTNEPKIVSMSNPRLLIGSPCIDAGTNQAWMIGSQDLSGGMRIVNDIVDMGAYEYQNPGSLTGALSVACSASSTQVVIGYNINFSGEIEGMPQVYTWSFGDGTQITNLFLVNHSFAASGVYQVTLTASNLSGSAIATVAVEVVSDTYYVAPGGGHISPYDTWAKAATNIQPAIDVAPPGSTVWVSNGVYGVGGRPVNGNAITNRVVIDKSLALRSVNGPEVTTIQGGFTPGSTNGSMSVRGVYVGMNASLEGFTVFGGSTLATGHQNFDRSGGGIWCETLSLVSNCIVVGNASAYFGGGTYYGTLRNCLIMSNSALYGGGSHNGTIFNSTITGNQSYWQGGGTYHSTLYNCLISINEVRNGYGGGSSYGALKSCTVTGNRALYGGGVSYNVIDNSVVYFNAASVASNNYYASTLSFSCATPTPSGTGNTGATPETCGFMNPWLLPSSPVIDAGTNQNTWMIGAKDWLGGDRIVGERVDMGAVEYPGLAGLTGALSVACSASPTQLITGGSVQLIAEVAGRPQGFLWNFGDGAHATNDFLLNHIFFVPGVYEITCTASNLSGSVTATAVVEVVSDTYFVAMDGGHISPYDTWVKAATNIQSAIDVAPPGSTVWVSNGVYSTGGRVIFGAMTNRVAIDKAITVQSVNGAAVTVIEGEGPLGDEAVRCVYVGTNATLTGFTLRNGHTRAFFDIQARETRGGGAWCENSGTLNNCFITDNRAFDEGGGASGGILNNCTVMGNSACYDGGTYGGLINNSIVYHNLAVCDMDGEDSNINAFNGTYNHTCTWPLPMNGSGNFTNQPLVAGLNNPYLLEGSPCVDAASNMLVVSSMDFDGEARTNGAAVDVGVDEQWLGLATGSIAAAIGTPDGTTIAVGYPLALESLTEGPASTLIWSFGDGDFATNQTTVMHTWDTIGLYDVILLASNGFNSSIATVTVTVVGLDYFVAPGGGHVAPYDTWATAATNIQDAIDAAPEAGATVWVSNGVYNTGGRPVITLTNRVVIDKALFLRSVNGPEVTIIEGAPDPITGLGPAAVRGVHLNSPEAVIEGFTIRGGHTLADGFYENVFGGGVFCNWSQSRVERCIIAFNKAADRGGGQYGGDVYSSAIFENEALSRGGGVYDSFIFNCNIIANRAGVSGGGVYDSAVNHSIIYYNSAPVEPNYNVWYPWWWFDALYPVNSCTVPFSGEGSFTNDPELASYTHLSSNSICIGASSYTSQVIDIDAEAWQEPPSIGCDEWYAGTSTGLLEVAISATHTSVPPGGLVGLSALIHGRPIGSSWSLGDGTVMTNQPGVKYSWGSVGLYSVILTAWNDTYPGGITATVTVNVVDQPDLVVTKTASVDVVPVGGEVEYTITLTNSGGASASNVILVDVLPDGVTPAGTFTNLFGSMSVGSSTTISYQVTVTSAVGVLVNTATVSTDSPEYFNTNNSATSLVSVYDPSVSADLAVALDNTDVQFISGGDTTWFLQGITTHDSVDAAQSGAIPDNGQTWIQATVTGPVDVTYWQKVSSEQFFDFLTVSIDGVTQPGAISGDVDWQKRTNAIPSGIHIIRWTYSKDFQCCIEGQDAAWLDEVVITPIGIVDSDSDGLPDWWETQYGLNPSVSNSASSDADWMTDLEEYIADTDPTNALSYFTNAQIIKYPGDVQTIVVDPTSTARVYQVHWITNLLQLPQNWNLLPPEQTGTGAAITFGVTNSGNYRTGVRLP